YHWTPYLFGGGGVSHQLSKEFAVGAAQTGGDPTVAVILPYGIGFKKILGPRLNLTAEFSTRVFLNKSKGSAFDGLDARQDPALNEYSAIDTRQSDFFAYPNIRQSDKYFQVCVTLSYLIYRV